MIALDTNTIIYYLDKDPHTTSRIEHALRTGQNLIISTIIEVELFSIVLNSEYELKLETFLSLCSRIPADSEIARAAARLRREYKIKTPDAIIAATALLYNAPLVTRNVRDFKKVRGLKLLKI